MGDDAGRQVVGVESRQPDREGHHQQQRRPGPLQVGDREDHGGHRQRHPTSPTPIHRTPEQSAIDDLFAERGDEDDDDEHHDGPRPRTACPAEHLARRRVGILSDDPDPQQCRGQGDQQPGGAEQKAQTRYQHTLEMVRRASDMQLGGKRSKLVAEANQALADQRSIVEGQAVEHIREQEKKYQFSVQEAELSTQRYQASHNELLSWYQSHAAQASAAVDSLQNRPAASEQELQLRNEQLAGIRREYDLHKQEVVKDKTQSAMTSAQADALKTQLVEAQNNMTSIIDGFNISRFGRATAKFDLAELEKINGQIIQDMPFDIVKDQLAALDVGGGATPEKIVKAFKLVSSDEKVKVILVNIFAGINRCDWIAEGIVQALDQIKIDMPLVIRLAGTNVEKGNQILRDSKINYIEALSLEDAANKAVAALKDVESN